MSTALAIVIPLVLIVSIFAIGILASDPVKCNFFCRFYNIISGKQPQAEMPVMPAAVKINMWVLLAIFVALTALVLIIIMRPLKKSKLKQAPESVKLNPIEGSLEAAIKARLKAGYPEDRVRKEAAERRWPADKVEKLIKLAKKDIKKS